MSERNAVLHAEPSRLSTHAPDGGTGIDPRMWLVHMPITEQGRASAPRELTVGNLQTVVAELVAAIGGWEDVMVGMWTDPAAEVFGDR